MELADVIIVGGGASGMMAAIIAGRRGKNVLLLEKNNKLGKKIYATGNGRCNFTNEYQTIDCYRSNHQMIAYHIINQFNKEKTLDFFDELGILTKSIDGYYYPNSEQAASVATVLSMELKRLKVTVLVSTKVTEIKKEVNGQFSVFTEQSKIYKANQLVLAVGGCASPVHGSDGSGFLFAKKFGHRIITPLPALTQLKAKGNYFKMVSGVRLEAYGRLFINGEQKTEEKGEFLFTQYGISGIPVLQMSRFAAEGLKKHQKVKLWLDFFKDFPEMKLYEIIKKRFDQATLRTIEEALTGVLNHKLIYILLKEVNIEPELEACNIKPHEIREFIRVLKKFVLTITDTNGFENAQVTAGGVGLDEVKKDTLESLLVPGLYFAGELLDVDGTCGGYNLQWAFSSGFVVGSSIL